MIAVVEFFVDSLSEQDTTLLGEHLAHVLEPGQIIALNGQLGSGKTNLIRAIGIALGIDPDRINSPTFVLLQLYEDGRLPVAHFDTYRLADSDEFLAIGGDEYLHGGEFVCLIEWAERIAEILPADHLTIKVEQTGECSRRFHFRSWGEHSDRLANALQQRTSG
ncbi:MAG: tRNA (adenosine(37)-N6)-threonylcarbamoyltransferase complex ATPase subunit type 1 TsaE [Planctomycetaceae bacterium]|nr:tRNA (adenosine(37)-N6)-threonylcarbamoyltransferase complex ATPase subunit type 1 TsaE [Planctomycetaceae bacterium]